MSDPVEANRVIDEREFNTHHLPHLLNYVIPIVPKGEWPASGVLVSAGGRHFVATAAHCIVGTFRVVKSLEPLQLHRSYEGRVRELRILGIERHASLDVGYVEIADPECAELGLEQLAFEAITEGTVQIVGYPQVLAHVDQRSLSIGQGTFGTSIIDRTANRILLSFPKSGWKLDGSGAWVESEFPHHPKGFSGGACFGVMKTPGLVERVEYKLLGIQYAWDKRSRELHAVPIKQWHEFLVDKAGL